MESQNARKGEEDWVGAGGAEGEGEKMTVEGYQEGRPGKPNYQKNIG